jgi:hypothetical protein
MTDGTDGFRLRDGRELADVLRAEEAARLNAAGIPADYSGDVWTTEEMQAAFDVEGFAAPYVVVRRKSDNARGTLTFTHSPRLYFDFVEVR